MANNDAPKEDVPFYNRQFQEQFNELLSLFRRVPQAIDALDARDREREKQIIYLQAKQDIQKDSLMENRKKIESIDIEITTLGKTLTKLDGAMDGVKWLMRLAGGAIILWLINTLLDFISRLQSLDFACGVVKETMIYIYTCFI